MYYDTHTYIQYIYTYIQLTGMRYMALISPMLDRVNVPPISCASTHLFPIAADYIHTHTYIHTYMLCSYIHSVAKYSNYLN